MSVKANIKRRGFFSWLFFKEPVNNTSAPQAAMPAAEAVQIPQAYGSTARLPQPAPVVGGMTCGGCNTTNSANNRFCKACGTGLVPAPAAPAPKAFCGTCGTANPDKSNFCAKCGGGLAQSAKLF